MRTTEQNNIIEDDASVLNSNNLNCFNSGMNEDDSMNIENNKKRKLLDSSIMEEQESSILHIPLGEQDIKKIKLSIAKTTTNTFSESDDSSSDEEIGCIKSLHSSSPASNSNYSPLLLMHHLKKRLSRFQKPILNLQKTNNNIIENQNINSFSNSIEQSSEQLEIECLQQEQKVFNPWEFLPNHLLILICSYLSQPCLIKTVIAVCKQWYMISKMNSVLWRKLDFSAHNFKVKTMEQVIEFIQDLKSLKIGNNGLNSQLNYFYFGGFIVPPLFSNLPPKINWNGEIILPTNFTVNCNHLRLLREVYPDLHSLVFSSSKTISNVLPSHLATMGVVANLTSDITTSDQITSSLEFYNGLDDGMLKQLVQFAKLRNLNLSNMKGISDNGISFLSDVMSDTLESIHIDYCSSLTGSSVLSLVRKCKKLKSINALGVTMKDEEIAELSTISNNLKELKVDVAYISFNTLNLFVKGFRQLRSLCFRGLSGLCGKWLELITSSLRYLEDLHLVCEKNTSNIYSAVVNSENMKSIYLSNVGHLGVVFNQCPSLNKVGLENCRDVSNIQFSPNSSAVSELRFRSSSIAYVNISDLINSLSSLKNLEIFDCQLGAKSALSICLPYLQKLVVFMCGDILDLSVQSSNLHSISVDACMNLEKLTLKCPKLENAQLFGFPQSRSPPLKLLHLESDELINLNLQKSTALEHLVINCKKLMSLNIATCQFLKHLDIISCPSLDKLALGSAYLSYGEDFITGLIRKCPNISMISIANSLLSDVSLSFLCENLLRLQALVISNCQTIIQPFIKSSSLKGLQVTDCNSLLYVGLCGEQLSKVFFRNLPNLHDLTFEQLSITCPNLKFIELINCKSLVNPLIRSKNLLDLQIKNCELLEILTIECESLKKLFLVSCKKFRNINFLNTITPLAEVLFSDCPLLEDNSVDQLSEKAPNIQAVVLDKCNRLKHPKFSLNFLKVLRFNSCGNLDKVDVKMNYTTGLSVLSFNECEKLKFDNISAIFNSNANIDNLELIGCNALKTCSIDRSVKYLNVNNCGNLSNIKIHSSDMQGIRISNCPSLSSTQFLPNSTNSLIEVKVKDCNSFSSLNFSNQAKEVKRVQFSRCLRISDMVLASIFNKCPNVEKIRLNECGISHPFFNKGNLSCLIVTRCPYVERITLKCPHLTDLKVTDCKTLSSLNFAENSAELKSVVLKRTAISASNSVQIMQLSSSVKIQTD
ncbi:hypothetical protein ABK040_000629 [Willaertia magna]